MCIHFASALNVLQKPEYSGVFWPYHRSTHCPHHLLCLLSKCQCGASLHLFHRQADPFTCHTCGLDWAELPRIEAVSETLVLEQKWLVWYEFFFSQGTYPIMREARRLVQLSWYEQLPLGDLVTLLLEHEYSPQDVLSYMNRMNIRSQLWMGSRGELW